MNNQPTTTTTFLDFFRFLEVLRIFCWSCRWWLSASPLDVCFISKTKAVDADSTDNRSYINHNFLANFFCRNPIADIKRLSLFLLNEV